MQKIIYHITTNQEWQDALMKGFYEASSLATEGFIHCSTEQQVEGVLQRYFAGKTDLDIKVKNMIRREQERVAVRNAEILADTLENRKLGIRVASS